MKRLQSAAHVLVLALSALLAAASAHAVVTTASLSNASIPFETVGTPVDVTINYTIDAISNVEIDIFFLRNVSDVPSADNQVAQIQQNGVAVGAHTYLWNALWLLGGDLGRYDGNFAVIVNANNGTTTSSFTIGTLLNITSVDIHNVTVSPSFDASQNPVLPYIISYALAKDSLVTVQIKNSTGSVVRTMIANKPQFNETVKPTNVLSWNGLDDNSRPVPLGVYTVTIDAKDPSNPDMAIQRTRSATIQSLASLDSDIQTTFENHVYVYPNPVHSGNAATTCGHDACFEFTAVRNNATITMKMYTIAGDLVLDIKSPVLATGELYRYSWDAVNQSGKQVGRGLYYYVVREDDEDGTLQTIKKLAVIR